MVPFFLIMPLNKSNWAKLFVFFTFKFFTCHALSSFHQFCDLHFPAGWLPQLLCFHPLSTWTNLQSTWTTWLTWINLWSTWITWANPWSTWIIQTTWSNPPSTWIIQITWSNNQSTWILPSTCLNSPHYPRGFCTITQVSKLLCRFSNILRL